MELAEKKVVRYGYPFNSRKPNQKAPRNPKISKDNAQNARQPPPKPLHPFSFSFKNNERKQKEEDAFVSSMEKPFEYILRFLIQMGYHSKFIFAIKWSLG